jgi:hypothetical protein
MDFVSVVSVLFPAIASCFIAVYKTKHDIKKIEENRDLEIKKIEEEYDASLKNMNREFEKINIQVKTMSETYEKTLMSIIKNK